MDIKNYHRIECKVTFKNNIRKCNIDDFKHQFTELKKAGIHFDINIRDNLRFKEINGSSRSNMSNMIEYYGHIDEISSITYQSYISDPMNGLIVMCKSIQNYFGSNIQELKGSAFSEYHVIVSKYYEFGDPVDPVTYDEFMEVENMYVTEYINDLCKHDKVPVYDKWYIMNYGLNNKEYQKSLQKMRKDNLVRKLDTINENEIISKRMKTY